MRYKLAECVVVLALSATLTTFSAEPPATQASDPSDISLPSFGLSFKAPPGWFRATELNYMQFARFTLILDRKVAGLFEVDDIVMKQPSTARELAAKFVAARGGEILPPQAANQQVVEAHCKPSEQFPGSVLAVVPVRNSLVVFSVGIQNPDAALKTLRTVVASIVISDPKPPSEDLQLRKRAIPLLDSAVLMKLPEPFRPMKVNDQGVAAAWGARNYQAGYNDASVMVRVVPKQNNQSLDEIVKGFSQKFTEMNGLKTPVEFEKVQDDPPLFLQKAAASVKTWSGRSFFTQLDASRYVMVSVDSYAPDPAFRDRYMTMAQAVAHSVQLSKAYEAGRRAGQEAGAGAPATAPAR